MNRLVSFHALALGGLVLALAMGAAGSAGAQAMGTVRGKVVAVNTMQPLSGAQVSLPNTGQGSLTNTAGEFLIVNVPPGEHTVRVQIIGFTGNERQVSVQEGRSATVDFQLSESAIALDEVVVTGTAGRQTRRSQPAQVAVVNAAEIVETAPVTSVTEVLQSRLPGVSVTHGSGIAGSAQRIRIRGASSISLSNEPLIFIDGVRVDSRIEGVQRPGEGSGSGTGTGGQATSRLNDLNPEDIESMEVVKGPAAATLYGADASAGVIQIITKRGKVGEFRQSVTAEYNTIDAAWTPPDNWAVCTQPEIDEGIPACQGLASGTLISDNPLVREDVFRDGHLQSLGWTGSGGRESFRYFLSLNTTDEAGTLPASELERRSGRVNVTWSPHPTLTLNAGYGLIGSNTRQPDNNHSLYGFGANAMIGSPLTLGQANDGWLATRRAQDIAAIKNTIDVTRNMPTLEVSHQPLDWFTHRVVVGGDFTLSERLRHIPKNDQNLYRSTHNDGLVRETRSNYRQITLDYLGSLTRSFGAEEEWRSDLALGVQLITVRDDILWADGQGLATNSAHVVSAAAESSGGQQLFEERSIGYLSQYQLGYRDRLFAQVGLRVDQNSSFGEDVDAVFLPKAGASWVLSEEPFWQDRVPLFGTLRLRAAYGVTGRAPRPGGAIESWEPRPYAFSSTGIGVGLALNNPGNPELRPERGTEFEAGVDASLLEDRLSMEVTYFNKVTKDLLLEREIPVSIGYLEDPFANIGKVVNRGVEAVLNAAIIQRPAFAWDVRLTMNTLHNELLELGDLPPFGQFERFVEGRELSSWFSPKIRNVDLANNVAIVSDTLEFIGGKLPDYEGSLFSGFTVGGNLRLSALFDWKTGFKVFNQTQEFRDRQVVRSREALDPESLSAEERLRRFGPFRNESGDEVNAAEVREAYFQNGDFIRFREVSVTYALPSRLTQRFLAERASITVGAHNLALWTKFGGPDPEALSNTAVAETAAFGQYDFFNIPPARRLLVRLNLGF